MWGYSHGFFQSLNSSGLTCWSILLELANRLAGTSLLYYFHRERLCNLCMLFSKTPIESFSTISLLSEDMKFQILGIPKGSEFISRDRACLRPLFN